jgi:hypothetical protein
MNNKLKRRYYVYLSAHHICTKILKSNFQEKTFDILSNIIFIIFLGLYSYILKIIQNNLGVTIDLSNYIFVIILLLVVTIFFINLRLKNVFKDLIGLSEFEILKYKSLVNKSILNWLFPIITIISLAILGTLVSMEI